MDANRKDYWKNVGLFEDCVKQGYNAGLISGSDAKRVIRMVTSQPDNLFFADVMAAKDVMKHPEAFNDWCSGILRKGSKEQMGANYAPRVEGHHPVSVSSSHAAGQHLPIEQHGKFIDGVFESGYPIGTIDEHMVPLSKNAHTGNAPIAAHVNPLTGNIDEGVWQGAFSGSDYGDDISALTDAFIEQSAEPQIRLAELATMQPEEQEFQRVVSEAAGVRPSALMYTTDKGKDTYANFLKKSLAKDKFDTPAAASEIYGKGSASRGGKKTSNNFLEEERLDANIVRRDAGLGGNEVFAQDLLGNTVMKLRANNPRRRL